MAEIRINATGGIKLYDADDSHYAQIVAGTITSNVDAITLGHDTVTIADNLSLGSDSAVLKFGADNDTTLTHTDGTGLTLNSTNKLCFNDASQFIQGSSATVLSIGATDEIDLTATAVDLNGTLNVSGVATFQSTPVFPDGSLALADLDIDGGTDIGAAIVDADLFIVDDGAGGANRKVTASRIKTYAGGASALGSLDDVTMDATNFVDSLVIQTDSDGSAPTTGTLSSATGNLGIGKDCLAAITSGTYNVALGYEAGDGLTTGANNILIGQDAGGAVITGQFNVAIGKDAGTAMTSCFRSVFIGEGAGQANTSGYENIAIGYHAYDGADTETRNIAIGYDALGGSVAGGEYNTAVGDHALDALTSGDANTALGNNAGTGTLAGTLNVFIGANSGATATTADDNTFVGHNSGYSHTTGNRNVYIGKECGYASTTAAHNNIIGVMAGDAITTGGNNCVLGTHALSANQTGGGNVAIGYAALNATNVGYNIGIGYNAGNGITSGANNICIGKEADTGAVDSANAICLGDTITAASNDFSFGKSSNVVTNDFDTDANWSRSSDARIKRNIKDDTLGLDFINDLRTVTYQWKPSNEVPKELTSEYNEENQKNLEATMHGFIAQEVKAAMDKVGNTTFAGWKIDETDGVTQRTSREMFVVPLIKAVQELSVQVTTLQDEIKTLKGE